MNTDIQPTALPVEEVATLSQTAAPAPAETQEKPVESQFVTREEMQALLAKNTQEERRRNKDRIKTIESKLDAMKTRMEAGGAQLTPQQVTVLREQITDEIDGVTADSTAAATASPQGMTPEMQRQADFVYGLLDEAFAEAGTQVTVNDPEWQDIRAVLDDPKGNPAKLIRVADKAAVAKLARLSAQKNTAAARVMSNGAQQSTTQKQLSADEKISKGLAGDWSNRR